MTKRSTKPLAKAKVLVVGIGNMDRGDDGIGLLVIRQLVGRLPKEIVIIEQGGNALGLIDQWADRDAVIMVDAAAPGSAPGQIHRIDLLADELPIDVSLSSTHAFGVADAVGLARTLGLLPRHVIVYAIEGAEFNPGAPLSRLVFAALSEVVTRIVTEVALLENELANV